jgi:hypothetical protein
VKETFLQEKKKVAFERVPIFFFCFAFSWLSEASLQFD